MQLQLRETGSSHMSSDGFKMFVEAHKDGKLLPPELPGHVIATLSLNAPKSLSGQFVSWNDECCNEFSA